MILTSVPRSNLIMLSRFPLGLFSLDLARQTTPCYSPAEAPSLAALLEVADFTTGLFISLPFYPPLLEIQCFCFCIVVCFILYCIVFALYLCQGLSGKETNYLCKYGISCFCLWATGNTGIPVTTVRGNNWPATARSRASKEELTSPTKEQSAGVNVQDAWFVY